MLTATGTLYGNDTFTAHVEPGQTVRLVGTRATSKYTKGLDGKFTCEPVQAAYDKTFKVGDTVVHGAYNLEYTGKIVSIGPKTVTVDTGFGERKRMKLSAFAFYNHDLDLAETSKRNHETMMYI